MLVAGCCATLATSSYEPPRIEDTAHQMLSAEETARVRVRLNAPAREQAGEWFIEISSRSESPGELMLVPEVGAFDSAEDLTISLALPQHSGNTAGSAATIDESDEDSGAADVALDAGAPGAADPVDLSAFVLQRRIAVDLTACRDRQACELRFRVERFAGVTGQMSLEVKSFAHRPLEEAGCLGMGPTAPDFTSAAQLEVTIDE